MFTEAVVAIDGSKSKAVNKRGKNFTEAKIAKRQQQIEESIERELKVLETADRTQPAELEATTAPLQTKIERLRQTIRQLDEIKTQLPNSPDGQISLTDPDARSIATSGRGSGMVGYNVRIAVDAKNHMVVAHDVINQGHDRTRGTDVPSSVRICEVELNWCAYQVLPYLHIRQEDA